MNEYRRLQSFALRLGLMVYLPTLGHRPRILEQLLRMIVLLEEGYEVPDAWNIIMQEYEEVSYLLTSAVLQASPDKAFALGIERVIMVMEAAKGELSEEK